MVRYGLIVFLVMALLPACGGGSLSTAQQNTAAGAANGGVGDPQVGADLFNQTLQLTRAPTCKTCHVVEANAEPIVGPNLYGIASVAGSRVPGQSAAEYLRAAIVAPNDFLVEGYQPGIMPQTYELYLSEQQINDIVAYMLTLE